MKDLKDIEEKIRGKGKKILFTEGDDKKIIKAAKIIKKREIAEVVLLKEVNVKDRLGKGVSMLKNNEVDGVISGISHPTADTIRAAFNFKKGLVSSFFLVLWKNKRFLFADCGVIPDPSYGQLAEITRQTVESSKLFNFKARVAMLSYSTKGSAEDGELERVRMATEIIKKKMPGLRIDGELQVDVAIDKEVAEKKGSKIIKGDANIFIFPDLNSGNIGYKLVERFGGAIAIGPILQNLAKPVNDLSRGATVEGIVDVAIITVLQSLR